MTGIRTIEDLIASFGGPSGMAAAINQQKPPLREVTGKAVTLWKLRNRVAWKYHNAILKAAEKHNIPVTGDDLIRLNADVESVSS